jgi:hypothetical protein
MFVAPDSRSVYNVRMSDAELDGFETFHRPTAPVSGEPSITIQSRGNLGLNAAAYEALGEPESVVLLFNRAKRVIALRAVDPHVPEAYPVSRQGQANSWTISGRAFLKEYGIPIGEARRYRASPLGDDVLTVDLNQDPAPAPGTRGKNPNRG